MNLNWSVHYLVVCIISFCEQNCQLKSRWCSHTRNLYKNTFSHEVLNKKAMWLWTGRIIGFFQPLLIIYIFRTEWYSILKSVSLDIQIVCIQYSRVVIVRTQPTTCWSLDCSAAWDDARVLWWCNCQTVSRHWPLTLSLELIGTFPKLQNSYEKPAELERTDAATPKDHAHTLSTGNKSTATHSV